MSEDIQKVIIVKQRHPITTPAVIITAIVMLVLVVGAIIYQDNQKALRDCVAGKSAAGSALERIDSETGPLIDSYQAEDSYADLEAECRIEGY